jgi:hypothetical protein
MKPTDPESVELFQPGVRGKAKWIAGGALFLIALALYFSLYWIPYGGIATPATEIKAVSYVKQLLLACRAYAADHEGAYPPNLGVLYPDYVDVPEIFFAQGPDGNDIPILYYPGLIETSAPDAVLIEHPVQYSGHRIIGTAGGRVLRDPVD